MISQQQETKQGVRNMAERSRKNAPVFVLGCPRSGTTVLYHMLLSAGGFAVYRSESNVFNLLAPRFGEMRSASDRKKLLDAWLNSMLFRVSGLDAARITAKVMEECHSPGDFLRIVMGEVAQSQRRGALGGLHARASSVYGWKSNARFLTPCSSTLFAMDAMSRSRI